MRHLKPCQCKGLGCPAGLFPDTPYHARTIPPHSSIPDSFPTSQVPAGHVIDALACLHRLLDFIDICSSFCSESSLTIDTGSRPAHLCPQARCITSHIRPGQENTVNLGTFFRCKQLMIVKYVRQDAADTLTAHRPHRPFPRRSRHRCKHRKRARRKQL